MKTLILLISLLFIPFNSLADCILSENVLIDSKVFACRQITYDIICIGGYKYLVLPTNTIQMFEKLHIGSSDTTPSKCSCPKE